MPHRLAYLIFAHRYPQQLRRLTDRLRAEGSHCWIHVDASVPLDTFTPLFAGQSDSTFLHQRYHCRWGDSGLTTAMLAGITEVHRSGIPYDHLLVLSGQDYPLVPTDTIVRFFSENPGVSFVHRADMDETNNAHLLSRVEQYHFRLPFNQILRYPGEPRQHPVKALAGTLLKASGRLPLPRVLPGKLKHHFGSNWLRLAPVAVEYLVRYAAQHPEILRYYQTAWVPEEHFFHTILFNAEEADRGRIIPDCLTYSHWHRPEAMYGVPLGMQDLPALQQSGELFARKFDITADSAILDALDSLP